MLASLHVCITTAGSCSSSTPLVDVLLPAVIGAALGVGASLLLRRGERSWQAERERDQRKWQRAREADARAWQEQRDRFARELQIAQPLDAALVATQRRVQGRDVPDGSSRWALAHDEWESGWVPLTPHLADPELETRYQAVGTILSEFMLDDQPGAQMSTKVQVAMRAIGNARIAIAYFLRGEPLPPLSFPTPGQVNELLGSGGPKPLAADAPLRTWLATHDVPPWRTPTDGDKRPSEP